MDLTQELQKKLGQERVKLNEPIKLHTSIKTGGPAKWYYEALSQEDLVNAVTRASSLKIPFFLLGGGTNVLFKDTGFDGLIIKNKTQDLKIQGFKGKFQKGKLNVGEVLVEGASGVTINQLVRFTLEEGLEGLQYFLGQPGTVGGAVYINAHFPKKHALIGDYIVSCKILRPTGETVEVPQKYFRFGYDKSTIQKTGDIVLSAKFKLRIGDKEKLWQEANEVLEYRKQTQPAHPSSGCTFRNIEKSDAMRLATPNFTQSAGFLIDKAGLKGFKIGGAQVSEKHANFIVNTKDATTDDILSLIKIIKAKVKEKYNVDLKEEVIII